jgi:hypothetical protein
MKVRTLPSARLAWTCASSMVASACFSSATPRGEDSYAA